MQDVVLNWKGTDYRVDARDVLEMIGKIEDRITLWELNTYAQNPEKMQFRKVACGFAVALRHAGAKVTDEEVYEGMFDFKDQSRAAVALATLMRMMVPPEALQEKDEGKKKVEAVKPEAAESSSSKRRTKRPSPGG
jgi:hypothetical protein